MRRTIEVLALALLAVTAGCSAIGSTASPGENATAPNQVTGPSTGTSQTVAVSASGQVQTAPNKALIRVGLTARADSVETVRQHLAQNASRMRTALREAGLEGDQIALARYDISRNHERDERPAAAEYQGQHSFILTLNNTDRAGEIVVTAVQNGATRIDEVRFTITEQTRRNLRKQALAEATENAHDKASVMANGTSLALSGIQTIQTADISLQPVRRHEVALAAGGDGGDDGVPTSFESGKVTVTAEVTAVYNATRS